MGKFIGPPTRNLESTAKILQQLYSLKISSSPDFSGLFQRLFDYDVEWYSSTLEGAELTRLVDFLDNAFCFVPTRYSYTFERYSNNLRAICSTRLILPSSHIIYDNLTKIGGSAIASGGFVDVWHGDHCGRKVRVKALRISPDETTAFRKSFFGEVLEWKRLRHPNIVPFLGVTTNPLQFVTEWMPNGTLTDYVTDNPSANRIALLLDIAEGLNFLHEKSLRHGDLKGPNILINGDSRACLADYGIARTFLRSDYTVTYARGYVTRWTAPEIIQGVYYITQEADVFSFGMVVIEVFTGKHPFSEFNTPSAIMKVITRERPVHPPWTENLGFVAPIWNMTANCWRHDPADRPEIAAVVEFLRECYALHTADPSLSTLSPWKDTQTSWSHLPSTRDPWSEKPSHWSSSSTPRWQALAAAVRFRPEKSRPRWERPNARRLMLVAVIRFRVLVKLASMECAR